MKRNRHRLVVTVSGFVSESSAAVVENFGQLNQIVIDFIRFSANLLLSESLIQFDSDPRLQILVRLHQGTI